MSRQTAPKIFYVYRYYINNIYIHKFWRRLSRWLAILTFFNIDNFSLKFSAQKGFFCLCCNKDVLLPHRETT